MELRHLQYFVAVAEELNFRRASERLHISTPALSVQIKKLETMLGVRLFDRDTAKVRLAVAGEILLTEARVLLQRVRDLKHALTETAQGVQGCLRIGVTSPCNLCFLPKALNQYRRLFPKVDVQLVEIGTDGELSDAMENRRVDVSFAHDDQLRHMSDIERLLIKDTSMHVVMAAQHPLAALERISLADLVEYPLLWSQHSARNYQHMLALLHEKKLKPMAVKKAQGDNTFAIMLAAGEGVSLHAGMCAARLAANLVSRPIAGAPSEFRLRLHAIWKNTGAPVQMLNFVDLLRQAGVQRD